SVGVAEVRPGETPEAWLERADKALYEAKNSGRDRLACAKSPEANGAG
ncbi:MAG: diguanylate cyclase, partial [Polyangiaceae bacterium]